MIRILVVSGIRLYREGLTLFLSSDPRVHVEGAVRNLDEALARAATSRLDVLLLDLSFEQASPVMGRIMEAMPECKIVVLGVPSLKSEIIGWVEAGVAGYVLKEASIEELIETLWSAYRGEFRCSAEVAGALQRRLADLASGDAGTADAVLTRRERQIAEYIDQGLTNKEIAARLCIEVATVKNHVHNVLAKLGARTRGEAAARLRRPRRKRPSREVPSQF